MKLIRLATDNDGVFQSSFQNDMIIAPKSQMALLNLTFKSEYDVLNVNSSNFTVTVKSDSTVASSEGTFNLDSAIYNEADYSLFLSNLKYSLNACLPDDDQINSISSQWDVRDYGGRKRVEYRYAPFFNPCNMKLGGDGVPLSVMSFDKSRILVQQKTDVGDVNPNHTLITKQQNIPGGENQTTSDNLLSSSKMCSGNGIMLIRINLGLDNGNTNIYDNGFGIGLSRIDLASTQSPGQEIPVESRTYEARFNKPTENYYYINRDANIVEVDSGVAPVSTGVGAVGFLVNRDTLYFKRFNGTLEVGVLQAVGGVGVKTVFFTTTILDTEVDLYPYIYINGSHGFMKLDMFNYSLDPWVNQSYSDNASDDKVDGWDFTGLDKDGATYNAYSNGLGAAIESPGVLFGVTGGYLNLVDGNDWTQSGTGTIERYSTDDLGDVATYKRAQVGTPGLEQWWEPVGTTGWNLYNFKPVAGDTASATATADLTTGVITIGTITFTPTTVPSLAGQVPLFPLPNPTNWEDNLICEVTLHEEIWKFLGFTAFGGNKYLQSDIAIGLNVSTAEQKCWSWRLAEKLFSIQQSDNFIVTCTSLGLDSFDASRVHYTDVGNNVYQNPATDKIGRRKNILMTIPVNDNTSGLVEYEASTPIFIDINNAQELNVKNLNFRVLNKDFDPVEQSGEEAIMTILIKKPNE
mgnify:FL=1